MGKQKDPRKIEHEQLKATIREKVSSDPKWAHRAIVVLFDRQTPSEQDAETTVYHNAVGFTAVDAEILTSFAKQIARGRTLSGKQLSIAHRRLPKYAGQLAMIAQGGQS